VSPDVGIEEWKSASVFEKNLVIHSMIEIGPYAYEAPQPEGCCANTRVLQRKTVTG
jgi:hypothetical protein